MAHRGDRFASGEVNLYPSPNQISDQLRRLTVGHVIDVGASFHPQHFGKHVGRITER